MPQSLRRVLWNPFGKINTASRLHRAVPSFPRCHPVDSAELPQPSPDPCRSHGQRHLRLKSADAVSAPRHHRSQDTGCRPVRQKTGYPPRQPHQTEHRALPCYEYPARIPLAIPFLQSHNPLHPSQTPLLQLPRLHLPRRLPAPHLPLSLHRYPHLQHPLHPFRCPDCCTGIPPISQALLPRLS